MHAVDQRIEHRGGQVAAGVARVAAVLDEQVRLRRHRQRALPGLADRRQQGMGLVGQLGVDAVELVLHGRPGLARPGQVEDRLGAGLARGGGHPAHVLAGQVGVVHRHGAEVLDHHVVPVLAGDDLLHLTALPVGLQAGAAEGHVAHLQRARLGGLDGHPPDHLRQVVIEGVAVAHEQHADRLARADHGLRGRRIAGHGLADDGHSQHPGQEDSTHGNTHGGPPESATARVTGPRTTAAGYANRPLSQCWHLALATRGHTVQERWWPLTVVKVPFPRLGRIWPNASRLACR